jgi:hypothetical protein
MLCLYFYSKEMVLTGDFEMEKEKFIKKTEKANHFFRICNRIIFALYMLMPISLIVEDVLVELFIRTGSHPLLERVVSIPFFFIYFYLIVGYPRDSKPLFPIIFAFQCILLIAEIITGKISKRSALKSCVLFVCSLVVFGVVAILLGIAAGLSI